MSAASQALRRMKRQGFRAVQRVKLPARVKKSLREGVKTSQNLVEISALLSLLPHRCRAVTPDHHGFPHGHSEGLVCWVHRHASDVTTLVWGWRVLPQTSLCFLRGGVGYGGRFYTFTPTAVEILLSTPQRWKARDGSTSVDWTPTALKASVRDDQGRWHRIRVTERSLWVDDVQISRPLKMDHLGACLPHSIRLTSPSLKVWHRLETNLVRGDVVWVDEDVKVEVEHVTWCTDTVTENQLDFPTILQVWRGETRYVVKADFPQSMLHRYDGTFSWEGPVSIHRRGHEAETGFLQCVGWHEKEELRQRAALRMAGYEHESQNADGTHLSELPVHVHHASK